MKTRFTYLDHQSSPQCEAGINLSRLRQSLGQTYRCAQSAIEAAESLTKCNQDDVLEVSESFGFDLVKLRESAENLKSAFPDESTVKKSKPVKT
tara:strand:- start:813 stop:1094 length:282 start_codon:yes stop_codon:yes gene_type:complete